MDPRAETLANKRLRYFARFCLLWGGVIVFRVVDLQILQHEKYANRALKQQERAIEVKAPRGAIYDRYGQTLAMSTVAESVCINPGKTPDPALAAQLLAGVLRVDENELLARISAARKQKSGSGFLWVKRRVTPEEARKLKSFNVDWIEFRSESTRIYPKQQLLAHVLGGVNFEENGNGGIEQSLNNELKGRPGIVRAKRDVKQNIWDQEVFVDAQPGKSLTLTIDERMQYTAEQELAAAVHQHGAKTGSLVAMDPKTGQILALANYPTYDPNEAPASQAEHKSRFNLAVSTPFEPGSVFKVITISAALETTRLTPDSSFHCGNGRFKMYTRVINDAHPYGVLSVADILAKSSNIGSIKIALEMGKEKFHEYILKFGFGQRTGLPLPAESPGLVRKKWQATSIASIAMGHEILTTTVQLAQACSVIANGGYLVKPSLILKKTLPDGTVEVPEKPARRQVLNPETVIKMRQMMAGVVIRGTGKRAQIKGHTSAGKTGSAQIYDYAAKVYTHRYNGSFVGFAPVNNPSIVVVVTLNGTKTGDAGFGGRVAAPVFKKVTSFALRLLDVPVDPNAPPVVEDGKIMESDLAQAAGSLPPELEAPEPQIIQAAMLAQGPDLPPEMASKGPVVPDFYGKNKRSVLEDAWALGVRVEIQGNGIARSQTPPPGVALRPGERVKVVFAP